MTTGSRPVDSRETPAASAEQQALGAGTAIRSYEPRRLTPEECFDLLAPGGVGRVGFAAAGGIVMLPVNFAVAVRTVIVRTAPDTQLAAHADGPVSFEADHLDEDLREGWSVLVQGYAHTVSEERAVQRLEARTRLQPWVAGARDVYVRIVPAQVSGRRVSGT
jgi:nitroimidazol reductase NimA-like FMN-containing flavoprotein (pyridoxamine 5'-phosphate oxidase superfamily)